MTMRSVYWNDCAEAVRMWRGRRMFGGGRGKLVYVGHGLLVGSLLLPFSMYLAICIVVVVGLVVEMNTNSF